MPKCDSCILVKQTRTAVSKVRAEGEGYKATRKLKKVWVDLSGSSPVKSHTGTPYIMNVVNDYSGFVWSIPLKAKSKALTKLQAWQCTRELETKCKWGCFEQTMEN